MPAQFTPGPSIGSPPIGEVERQAVASLRGYAYQIAAATLAWIDLGPKERIYLEVAEDYATVAQRSLDAVQVKDTAESGSITLSTESVREAIHTFVSLVASNQDRRVQLRFLTTSSIGIERKISDRPAGEAGLLYWRRAAAGADVQPLRNALMSPKFSAAVHAFVEARDNETLRRELLQKIFWDCGKPDLAGVMLEIEERLIVLSREIFGLPAADAKQLAILLPYHALKKSVLKSPADRALTRADLFNVIDAATQISMPRQFVGSLLDMGSFTAALADGRSVATVSAVDTSWLISSTDFPQPRGVIERQDLKRRIIQALSEEGQVVLVGGSGLGKSLVARQAACERPEGFVTVDLREADAKETTRRLNLTLGRIGALHFSCLIFDDFNQIEDSSTRVAFVRCVQALRRRDRTSIVTAYRRPSHKALSELGIDADAVIEIPYFSEQEAEEVVRLANGDPNWWGRIAFTSGAQGHPQLVHAFVMGMAARKWPRSDVREIVVGGFSSDDIDAERDAARRNMVAALPEEARNLLYRLSLVIGRFGRTLALRLAEVSPPVPRAGEMLDSLIGPWLELVGKDSLRVSPLAAHAGRGMLTDDMQQAIHAATAAQMLASGKISASDANGILMHGLLGKEPHSLFRLAYAVLTTVGEAAEALIENLFVLPLFRFDQPIFSESPAVSIMLRLAQFKLVAASNENERIARCADSLFEEIGGLGIAELRTVLEGVALATILNTIGIASSISDWVALLQRFKSALETNQVLEAFKNSTLAAAQSTGLTFHGALFSIGSSQLKTVKRLEEIFNDLDGLSDADRATWLQSVDYSLLINPPWTIEQSKAELDAANAAERYERMAVLALKWGLRALAIECYIARAVMFDEYMDDEKGAGDALDLSVAALGEDVATSRARARICWRRNRHQEAVKIVRDIAHLLGRESQVDRAFALREGAISAAKINDWGQAGIWFGEAEKSAAASGTREMQIMSIGLEADRSVAMLQSGDVEAALRAIASCLQRLREVFPEESLRAAYSHRVIRHTVLWMESSVAQRETTIDGKPIEMLPGTCSNPQPPASITELPLGPIDVAWYMLAEAEISAAIDVGIGSSLRTRLLDGPIVSMEINLRHKQITMDVLRSDTSGFSRHLVKYVEGIEYMRREGRAAGESFGGLSPPRGDIPPLSDADLAEPSCVELAIDALLAFRARAVLQGMPDKVRELDNALTLAIGADYPGKIILNKWQGFGAPLAPLNQIVSEALDDLQLGLYLTPRRIWEIGLRLFERLQLSGFRNALIPLLAIWFRGQWARIVGHETFRLTQPMQAVPALRRSIAETRNDDSFLASLLLAAAGAVGSPLSAEYEARLLDLANRR
ncbi:hypothetical protein SAMN05216573_10785 [Bradyrhizobium sp. Rc3b]|uniref:hypothetical protein n=1 Tax=Bradyrhizobium sp. Rc3b TaxID=1855322 RepID=UPI0008E062E2|nr:hypothetical protein [Bradyrhizobium sp. Rc3b]SFN02720.1 hypothetical protein SAMN05216573_10785 [Bradyrhizobium sp. Rc3b]